jgi:hypothetical protein
MLLNIDGIVFHQQARENQCTEMSVRRFAAVEWFCIFLMAAPFVDLQQRTGSSHVHKILSVLSGHILHGEYDIYIDDRRYGVVQTSISTTATSFVAITIAGILMSETVGRDIAAMVAISLVTVGWRLCK